MHCIWSLLYTSIGCVTLLRYKLSTTTELRLIGFVTLLNTTKSHLLPFLIAWRLQKLNAMKFHLKTTSGARKQLDVTWYCSCLYVAAYLWFSSKSFGALECTLLDWNALVYNNTYPNIEIISGKKNYTVRYYFSYIFK